MALSSLQAWRQFARVEVDLRDVRGTPGIRPLAELREGVAAFGTSYRQMSPSHTLFLMGLPAKRFLTKRVRAEPGELLHAFATGTELLPAAAVAPRNVSVDAVQSATGTHLRVNQVIRGAEVVGGRFTLDVADRIALESLYFLDEHSSFEDGRAALQAADRMLFPDADGGAHERAIEEEFAARRPAS